MFQQPLFQFSGVPSRISANVCHKYFYALAVKNQIFRIGGPYILPVNITKNSFNGFYFFNFKTQIDGSNITGVPNFIGILNVLEQPLVKVSMCIGY